MNNYKGTGKYFNLSTLFIGFMLLHSPVYAQLELRCNAIDDELFPIVHLLVTPTSGGAGIAGLSRDDFEITEEAAAQTIMNSSGNRMVDIVFVVDASGSMDAEIQAVIDNIENFLDGLESHRIDWRAGFIEFGNDSFDTRQHPNPYVFNNGNLTSERAEITDILTHIMESWGGTEPGLQSIFQGCQNINFRPASSRRFLLMTDEKSDGENPSDCLWQAVAECANSNDIVVDCFINEDHDDGTGCGRASEHYGQADPAKPPYAKPGIGVCGQTGGLVFSPTDSMDSVLQEILNQVASGYDCWYSTTNPAMDCLERHVQVTVDYGGEQSSCSLAYTPVHEPVVIPVETICPSAPLDEGDGYKICREIISCGQTVDRANIYYRQCQSGTWLSANMTHTQGDNWCGSIPGSGISDPCVEYYVQANQENFSATDPSADSALYPYMCPVASNEEVNIVPQPMECTQCGSDLVITAYLSEYSNRLLLAGENAPTCFVREIGTFLYSPLPMTQVSGGINGGIFECSIPASIFTGAGVEYYLRACDDLGFCTTLGTADLPLSFGCPCSEECVDEDQDGYDTCGPDHSNDTDGLPADCNDADSFVNPGIDEAVGSGLCDDQIDQDCDGNDCTLICIDNDGDGYGVTAMEFCVFPERDCDDNNQNINPEQEENLAARNCRDGKDNDCDGLYDYTAPECHAVAPPDGGGVGGALPTGGGEGGGLGGGDDSVGCGCIIIGSSKKPGLLQIILSALSYLLPVIFILIRRQQILNKLE